MARNPGGFSEGQSPFGGAARLFAIHSAFECKCAFTGIDLTEAVSKDPAGTLLFLDANASEPGTAITASMEAIHAYERGHLAIGPRYEFLAALDRIDPEFLERLNPIGRLPLPADPLFYPNAALLKIHREAFAEGFID